MLNVPESAVAMRLLMGDDHLQSCLRKLCFSREKHGHEAPASVQEPFALTEKDYTVYEELDRENLPLELGDSCREHNAKAGQVFFSGRIVKSRKIIKSSCRTRLVQILAFSASGRT